MAVLEKFATEMLVSELIRRGALETEYWTEKVNYPEGMTIVKGTFRGLIGWKGVEAPPEMEENYGAEE